VTTFRSETHQNPYIAVGATSVNAVVSITASGSLGVAAAAGPNAAEIIIVDVSGSMNYPRTKIRSARAATAAAIDCIRDGVRFGVIAGTDTAHQVYPSPGRLVEASDATRADAKRAVEKLSAGGGTAMGWWLLQANELFRDEPPGIRHALLLTDGQNADETPEDLDRALRECEGNFQCDCRGVGADWKADELREISTKLLGETDVIREPESMAADFQEVMERAMGRRVSDVSIRLWTPVGAEIAFVKQAFPEIADFTDRRVVVSEREGDYPTGAWGDEVRDYHVSITVPARDPGDEMLAGRVKVVIDGEVVSEEKLLAIWSEEESLTVVQPPKLVETEYRNEYAEVATELRQAQDAGDEERATAKLQRLQTIATILEDPDKLRVLGTLSEVDPVTGKVKPRTDVDAADLLEFETRSVKTNRTHKPES
jgi:hypothetical protein